MAGGTAGIDVHTRVLMVVVGQRNGAAERERVEFAQRKFGTTSSELVHLKAWLQEHGVAEVVMESTAQYWKPVWLALEECFRLRLAQAWSAARRPTSRTPRGWCAVTWPGN